MAANPAWLENCCPLLQVWKVQIFFNLIVNPTDKVVRTKPKSVVVLPMSFLINPEPNDNKNGQNGERKQFQSHMLRNSRIPYYVTICNQRHPKVTKEE
jgi:hypothetical protein